MKLPTNKLEKMCVGWEMVMERGTWSLFSQGRKLRPSPFPLPPAPQENNKASTTLIAIVGPHAILRNTAPDAPTQLVVPPVPVPDLPFLRLQHRHQLRLFAVPLRLAILFFREFAFEGADHLELLARAEGGEGGDVLVDGVVGGGGVWLGLWL